MKIIESKKELNKIIFTIFLGIFLNALLGIFYLITKEKLFSKIPIEFRELIVICVPLLVLLIIYLLLSGPIGRKLYKKWQDIKLKIVFFRRIADAKAIYPVEERTSQRFKSEILSQIQNSRRIYFKLISGFTMFYDPREKFIYDALYELRRREVEDKDIKIQLLDRKSENFRIRGIEFAKRMEETREPFRCSFDEYLRRCEKIEGELRDLMGTENIGFYQRKPIWRYYIFDDTIFVSNYGKGINGHLTVAYQLHRIKDSSLYTGFLDDFDSLYLKKEIPF